MNGLAIVMFVALFAFGKEMFGWTDHHGHVQIAIVAAFLFGVLSTWRTARP